MSQYIGRVRSPPASDKSNLSQTRLAFARQWHHVDLAASPLTLGRVASRIAVVLMGKHKPTFDPSTDCGDYVVATACARLKTTGRKMEQKMYYSHSTRPGSLKSMSMERLMEKWGGAEVLRRAVRGMLPKNRLRATRLARLKGESLAKSCRGRANGASVRGEKSSAQVESAAVSGTGGQEHITTAATGAAAGQVGGRASYMNKTSWATLHS
jgi:large subunit ribosomal protein L13